jgi:hypothetical protein
LGLFDWLKSFGDPTKDWPKAEGALPVVNRRVMQFDPPRFGEPMEALRVFGRPDSFVWRNRRNQNASLGYFDQGLELDLELGRFVTATYFMSESVTPPNFKPARPKAPNGAVLTPDTRRPKLIEIFGTPDRDGTDEETMMIVHGATASDFLFDDDGRLEQWSIFLND